MARFASLRGLQGLDGASGSFGPVETKGLGLPQPLVWQQKFGTRKGTTWLATASSFAAPRGRLAGLTRLKPLVWLEKERLDLPQPLVWQQMKSTPNLRWSQAPPRPWLRPGSADNVIMSSYSGWKKS